MSKILTKISDWLTVKKTAVFFTVLFALSLIPVLYLGWYDYPTGDSLGYGAAAHHALLTGSSFFSAGFWRAIFSDVWTEFLNFNGTWSAMFLWRLDPSIWSHVNASGNIVGTHIYGITPYIAIGSICIGTAYILHVLLVKWLNLPKAFSLAVFSLTAFLTIQWIPTARGGIYFYPGVIKYILAYGIMLLGLGWLLRAKQTGKISFLIFSSLALIFVGGAGYPEFLIAAASCALIFLVDLITFLKGRHPSSQQPGRLRWALLIPFLLFMVSFAISAKAPGTAARGGENVSFTAGKAISTIVSCFTYGASQAIQYLKTAPLILAVCIGLILSSYALAKGLSFEELKEKAGFCSPLLFVSGYLVYAASFAAELFVGENVTAGISGGVFDTYFMIFVLTLVIGSVGFGYWLNYVMMQRQEKKIPQTSAAANNPDSTDDTNTVLPDNSPVALKICNNRPARFRALWILFCLILCIAGGRHLFRNTLDYACMDFIRSGRLSDFIDQTDEYKAILFDDRITDAVLPQMNDDQYPFMFMAPTEDAGSFTNFAMENFYGKDSVIAIPRNDFYQEYGDSIDMIQENERARQ